MSALHSNLFPRPFVAKQHEPKVLYGILVIEFSLQALTIFISDVHYHGCLLTLTKSILKFRILLCDVLLISTASEPKGVLLTISLKVSSPVLSYKDDEFIFDK